MVPEISIVYDASFLNENYEGGIVRDSKSFLLSFLRHDWTVQLLNYGRGKAFQDEQAGIENLSVLPFNYEFLRAIVTKLPIKIESTNPFIYFKSQPSPLKVINSRHKGLTVIRIHDIFPISNPEWFTKKSTIKFKIGFNSMEPGSLLVANSKSTLDSIQLMLGKEFFNYKTAIVSCEPTVDNLKLKCRICLACIKGIPDQNFVLAVGTIEPRKNYQRITKAWENSHLPNKEFRLVIVGGLGWKYSGALKAIKESRTIVYLGNICDFQLSQLYSNALGFISGSFNEGYNIPLDEARARKKHLILSDIVIHHERVKAEDAIWFNPNDTESIIGALNNFSPMLRNAKYEHFASQFYSEFLSFSNQLRNFSNNV